MSVGLSGKGMDEETQEKVFEPFFTTKEVGKGTGLGLSIVYGIIKQHRGLIDVRSELEKGTTFKISLPLIMSEADQKQETAITPPQGGTETVLIAEDNTEVREITRKTLEKVGYKVIEAEDGEVAVERFRENRESVQLLLLDVVMPRRSVKEVYEEIRKVEADMKVLFMSGYTADIIHKKGLLEEDINYISKPFTTNSLLRKVREALDT